MLTEKQTQLIESAIDFQFAHSIDNQLTEKAFSLEMSAFKAFMEERATNKKMDRIKSDYIYFKTWRMTQNRKQLLQDSQTIYDLSVKAIVTEVVSGKLVQSIRKRIELNNLQNLSKEQIDYLMTLPQARFQSHQVLSLYSDKGYKGNMDEVLKAKDAKRTAKQTTAKKSEVTTEKV